MGLAELLRERGLWSRICQELRSKTRA
jgi:hypothetical protein